MDVRLRYDSTDLLNGDVKHRKILFEFTDRQEDKLKQCQRWYLGLMKMKPMQSFLRPSYLQVMSFILRSRFGEHTSTLDSLINYLNELKVSFETLQDIDQVARKSSLNYAIITETDDNLSLLIQWSLIEAAKYCVVHNLSTEEPPNQHLKWLESEFNRSFCRDELISRRFLIYYWQILDKLLQDHLFGSSFSKPTFSVDDNIEKNFKVNRDNLKTWLTENRTTIGQLSLLADDAAECWRNVNIALCFDFNNVAHDLSKSFDSYDAGSWIDKVRLLVWSARQLGDTNLLKGLRLMPCVRHIVDDQHIFATLCNLEGHYREASEHFRIMDKPNDIDLIEFLNAFLELNTQNSLKLFENNIDQLESDELRYIYRLYYVTMIESHLDVSRFDEIESWLCSWSSPRCETNTIIDSQPMQYHLDMIIPSLLNIIAKVPSDEKESLIQRTTVLMEQEVIVRNLFPPNQPNGNFRLYSILLDCLKHNKLMLDENVIETKHFDDGMCHKLFRYLSDLNMIDDLRASDDTKLIDLLNYRAARYHINCENIERGESLTKKLISETNSTQMRLLSSLLLIKCESNQQIKLMKINELASKLNCDKSLDEMYRIKLGFKIFNKALKLNNFNDSDELQLFKNLRLNSPIESKSHLNYIENQSIVERYIGFIASESSSIRIKTMLIISNRLNTQLSLLPSDNKLLNQVFLIELELLMNISEDYLEYQANAIECSMRILNHIKNNHDRLDHSNLEAFGRQSFINSTKSIWLALRTNLVSLICHHVSLGSQWREKLINIVMTIVMIDPSLFIYDIIVNRFNIQTNLMMNDESYINDGKADLLNPAVVGDYAQSKAFEFWNDLYRMLNDHSPSLETDIDWSQILTQTERFLKEIKKISYLPAEALKLLISKIPRKLYNIRDHFAKFVDQKTDSITSQHMLQELQAKLISIYDNYIGVIKLLLNHCYRSHETKPTAYDSWFSYEFSKHLKELEYRFKLLVDKGPVIFCGLNKVINSITNILGGCNETIESFQLASKQRLYMEMISPMLSRLKPSAILMPEYNDNNHTVINNEFRCKIKKPITIHKVSQAVPLIVSKTSPKKLSFTGSDGISRSFLLKAHEDLRLDRLIMELFGTINCLLNSNKKTRGKFKLQQYSITPISDRSGLIQWIEAPSLSSFYRSWLESENGKDMVKDLYKETCPIVCGNSRVNENLLNKRTSDQKDERLCDTLIDHKNCQIPSSVLMKDIFYQLLWAYAKQAKPSQLAKTKPSLSTTLKYRAEFEVSLFENVIQDLMLRMPKDILSRQLWFNSSNSYDYWTKTQSFIQSYATSSIVGYIIGLGDRHPDNILLDCNTGNIIHVDYNLCFDLDKLLPLPQKVPFRLTQCIVNAFGFAGLQGGFRYCCQEILETLKLHKSTFSSHLSSINLNFMIDRQSNDKFQDANLLGSKLPFDNGQDSERPIRKNLENPSQLRADIDLFSQESISVEADSKHLVNDGCNLAVISNTKDQSAINRISTQIDGHLMDKLKNFCNQTAIEPQVFDLHHYIKTPPKILAEDTIQICERLVDKLSGNDKSIRNDKVHDSREPTTSFGLNASRFLEKSHHNGCKPSESIVGERHLTTEEQVDALIYEATLIENKAKMFEGWLPWF